MARGSAKTDLLYVRALVALVLGASGRLALARRLLARSGKSE